MRSRRNAFLLVLVVCGILQLQGRGEELSAFDIAAPELVLAGTLFRLEVTALDENGHPAVDFEGVPAVTGLARFTPAAFVEGRLEILDAEVDRAGRASIAFSHEGVFATGTSWATMAIMIPPWSFPWPTPWGWTANSRRETCTGCCWA